MSEIVAGFLAPILRQFNYLCCFSGNITSLKNEAQKLQDTERDLQGKVDAAINDLRLIPCEVETWLQSSKEIKDEMDGIMDEVPNVEGGCLKLRARFSLSRRAMKTTDRLKELRDQCKFNDNSISLPGPPPATKAVPSESSYEFKSRKQIEEDIMTTLRGEDVKMIGICGMRGLGKTTMAKRIMNRALEEHVFEEVVMAVVSRPIDKLKIQLEIGGSLGLKKLQEETLQARVQKLHARLSGPKRILLVLDDVWERFQPEDLGIPCDWKGCTILLTSPNRDVLSVMNVQKIFGMDLLSIEDSWLLFRMVAGQCVDDTKLNSIAKEVVSECAGLPIVLRTVGAALKGEVDVSIWENALQRLKINCTPDIPEYIAEVYNSLKLSYDVLGRKYQDVFLLCCLYPEDDDIPLEHLTYFCMGLRIATGNVEEARNMICALTKVLKNRSLLLDSERGDDYVRMHDVVRDVCIYIAKHEGYIGGNDLTSSLQRYKLHYGFELLQIRNSDEEINFDGITDLSVLSIEWCSQLTSLPFTQRPNNLITLVLVSCEGLETLSVVGELVNLEILICRNCNLIVELPPEIKGLNRLKVLDLTRCGNLERIGRGIISSLVGLEELKMLMSFNKWEAEDREEMENAGLKELGQLTKLRCLEIEIEDLALAAENIRLSLEVDRFTIRFKCESRWFLSKFDEYLSNKKMCLNWEGASCLGDWIKLQLLRDTECLMLVGNGANEVGLTNLKKMRYLELGRCESMKNVVTTSMDDGGGATVFPSLDHLILFNLPKLEEICDDRISSNFFQNLKILKLHHLPVLKQLWKSSQNDLGMDFLPQLEVLEIWCCEMMEGVFSWKGEDGNENNSCHPITIMFPKLKDLVLEDLPNLISLCQGIEGIEFPVLRTIMIEKCGKMKGMVANGMRSSNENNLRGSNNAGIHLFCSQQVSFGCLEKLRTDQNPLCSHRIHVSIFNGLEELNISNCVGSLSLFKSSIAANLVNLKELQIADCDEMEQVIMDDEEKGMSGGLMALLFPKLHTLCLWNLPKLVRFCVLKCDVEFPSLREVEISGCNNMKSCTLGPLITPNLKIVRINGQDLDAIKDLNGLLQQLYLSQAEKLEFHGESHVVDEATHVADAEFSSKQQGTEPTSTKADRSKHHEQIQVVDEATHVADAEFSSEQQGTKPTSSNAKRSKHHGESQVVDEATPVADAEFFGEQQGTEPTSSKAERSKHHRQIQVVDEATHVAEHVADVEFSGEQQGTEPTSSKAERSKYHVEIQVVDEATPVADAEFSGEQQGTEPTSSEAKRSKRHRQIQIVDEATHVADVEFSGEIQGTEPISSKAERSKYHVEIQVVDEATPVADAEICGEHQETKPTSSEAERSKHHREIQVVDEAEISGEHQETKPTSSEAERSKHHREIQVVDEATLVADAEFSGQQQGTEPTSSEAERSKDHREIQVVDEATPVADAEFSREQQGTKPTSSKAERSKHHQECSLTPCLFEEKGHYMIDEENNHLQLKQLKLGNHILSISIGDYPSPAPPHSFPVNAMLNCVEQDLRELPEGPNCSSLLLLFLQRNKRLTVIHPSFFDSMPDLHFLDISDTKIRTLPRSLFKLSKLKVLMLRNCVCLENLPSEIGNLYNMEALDLSGTELYNLPDEIGELTLLRSLQLSLYGPDDESEYDHLPTQLVSPSFLSKLKEIRSLSISVHPEDYRWTEIVSCILKDISKLEMLSSLQFYSPEVEAFEDFIKTSPSWRNQKVSKFDFNVGQNVKRVVSRVPDEVESLFNQQERCLRYVNGDKASSLIETVLSRVTAFYLDHHTEVQSLSEFNNSSFQELKFCVVRECPKIQAILDGNNAESEFPCLEHLEIYFLWELEHIWKPPSHTVNSAALRSLIISTCPKLQFVFCESMLQSLTNLKELVVEDCECMKRIIEEENKKVKYEDNVLAELTRLVLHYLPVLVSVGNDVRVSKEIISIHGCPKFDPSISVLE